MNYKEEQVIGSKGLKLSKHIFTPQTFLKTDLMRTIASFLSGELSDVVQSMPVYTKNVCKIL